MSVVMWRRARAAWYQAPRAWWAAVAVAARSDLAAGLAPWAAVAARVLARRAQWWLVTVPASAAWRSEVDGQPG